MFRQHSFRFWLNDDNGYGNVSGSDVPQGAGNGNGITPTYLGSGFPQQGYEGVVNGVKDLVNYFPVYLNIQQLLKVLPPGGAANITYQLSQADGALNFVYSNLTVQNPFNYLRPPAPTTSDGAPNFQTVGPLQSGFGIDSDGVCDNPADSAQKFQITSGGIALNTTFLNNIVADGNQGIILVEGRAVSTNPLVLSVIQNGTVVANVSLSLSIGNIEDMYRHLNLRTGSDAPSGLLGVMNDNGQPSNYSSEPSNLPDSLSNGNWIVQMHGYNVSGNMSRGWEAETFKELYWSHSHAKFVGVCWFGDPYDYSGEIVPNYQTAAQNAFLTGKALEHFVDTRLSGGNKTIICHSLSSMAASSALEDFHMNVTHAVFVDGAVAQEAFDGNQDEDLANMTLSSWVTGSGSSTTPKYPRNLWATNWWSYVFNGTSDVRGTLTWQNRFNGQNGLTSNSTTVSKIYNFYSPTENVLTTDANDPTSAAVGLIVTAVETLGGDVGQNSWVIQEKTKGNQISIPYCIISGNLYMGWGFNVMDPVNAGNISDPIWYDVESVGASVRIPKTPSEVAGVSYTSGNIARSPLFLTGWGSYDLSNATLRVVDTNSADNTGPTWILNLYSDSLGSSEASLHRNQLLAEAIPALSLPIGANPITTLPTSTDLTSTTNRNFNIPLWYVDYNHWPSARGHISGTNLPVWFHSDMHDVAYPYLYDFYDQLVYISTH